MHPNSPLLRSDQSPTRQPTIAGSFGVLFAVWVLLAFVSYPLLTTTVVAASIATAVGVKRATTRIARRLDGHHQTVHIPRIGTIDYRFTTQ